MCGYLTSLLFSPLRKGKKIPTVPKGKGMFKWVFVVLCLCIEMERDTRRHSHYTDAGLLQLSPYFEKSINNIVKVTFKILIRKKDLFYREIIVNSVEASSVFKKDWPICQWICNVFWNPSHIFPFSLTALLSGTEKAWPVIEIQCSSLQGIVTLGMLFKL